MYLQSPLYNWGTITKHKQTLHGLGIFFSLDITEIKPNRYKVNVWVKYAKFGYAVWNKTTCEGFSEKMLMNESDVKQTKFISIGIIHFQTKLVIIIHAKWKTTPCQTINRHRNTYLWNIKIVKLKYITNNTMHSHKVHSY